MNNTTRAFPEVTGGSADSLVNLIASANSTFPEFITSIVDGGAGIGDSIGPILPILSPSMKVIGYEPLPENANVLRQRFANTPAVDIREFAISDRAGVALFDVPSRVQSGGGLWSTGTSYGGYVRRISGPISLLRFVRHMVMSALRPLLRHNRYQTVQVKTVRLDDDLQFTPDIVKLDLQGGEPAALRGLGERLRQVKIVKAEVHMLHGEARRECVRILKEAGFKMYIGDLQFSVPEVSSTLRSMMAEQDIRIEHELRGSAFDAQTMIIGKWSGEQPLPFQDLDFTPAFESLLRAEKTNYFSVDLIAINLKYAESWNVLLPSINL